MFVNICNPTPCNEIQLFHDVIDHRFALHILSVVLTCLQVAPQDKYKNYLVDVLMYSCYIQQIISIT